MATPVLVSGACITFQTRLTCQSERKQASWNPNTPRGTRWAEIASKTPKENTVNPKAAHACFLSPPKFRTAGRTKKGISK
jgi:hypothetical protein